MKRAKTLQFVAFSVSENRSEFTYKIDNRSVNIFLTHSEQSTCDENAKKSILFNIGMCYLTDIASVVFPEKVIVNFPMTDLQLEFWKTMYQEVSREIIYLQRQDFSILNSQWEAKQGSPLPIFHFPAKRNQIALCLTGGKDSLVLFNMLQSKINLKLLFLNIETNLHRQRVFSRVSNYFDTVKNGSNAIVVLSILKKKYKREWPGSSSVMFHLVLNTLLFGDKCKYVLIANDYSSHFPNLVYQGYSINHQYCKTVDVAININNYLHRFVTPDFHYFSPFFGIYEYKIMAHLFQNTEYIDVWTSCNRAEMYTITNFCSKCYKCAFVYLLALVHAPDGQLDAYFSRSMLEDVELYKPLMDFLAEKPLDCVGEKKEVWVALSKLMNKKEYKNTSTIRHFKKEIYPIIKHKLKDFEDEINSVQIVPQELPQEIKKIMKENGI